MGSSWEDFKKDAIVLKERLFKKAKELKDLGKIKLKIYNLEGDRNNGFKEIGAKVYEYHRLKKPGSAAGDSLIKEVLGRLDAIAANLDSLRQEYDNVKKSGASSDNK